MAFRLRPLHEDTLQFAGLSNTQILILALEASQKLEWNIEELTLVNPEKPDVPINKNDAFQKVQKRRVQEKR